MNNKRCRVITINGIKGILVIVFIIFGLVSGFIISPSWVCMKLWNILIANNFTLPVVNIYQGLLIWGVIALTFHALNKESLIGIGSYTCLSNEQIREIVAKSGMNAHSIMRDMENRDISNSVADNNTNTENKEEIRG